MVNFIANLVVGNSTDSLHRPLFIVGRALRGGAVWPVGARTLLLEVPGTTEETTEIIYAVRVSAVAQAPMMDGAHVTIIKAVESTNVSVVRLRTGVVIVNPRKYVSAS